MALTQMQTIQSLGDAINWLQRELTWGVDPAELRHLTGRIGELYVALITNGQMALEVNQRGYDVVSKIGERISVKTTTMMSNGHVSFNERTLDQVDRIIILRLNTEDIELEILLDKPREEARTMMVNVGGDKIGILLNRFNTREIENVNLIAREVSYDGWTIRELETGTIQLFKDGVLRSPANPILRKIAASINLSTLNANGNPFNTRQLGTQLITYIQALTH